MQRTARVAAIALILIPGCSAEPRLDASSRESLRSSFKAMTANMDEAGKKRLAADVMAVAFPDIMKSAFLSAFGGKGAGPRGDDPAHFRAMHGMTAAEIHARAEEVRARMRRPPSK